MLFHAILDIICTREWLNCTRKMVPITGRASSFLVFLEFSKQNREEGETE